MSSPRRFFVAFAVCLILRLGLATVAPSQQYEVQSQAADDARANLPAAAGVQGVEPEEQADSPFTGLLNAVSPEALHDVLHRYFPTRFKDGIYESDHSAMEAVHRADPPLATSLIRIAKRQNNGTTTDPTTGPTTGPTTLPTTTPTTSPTTSTTSSSSSTRSQTSDSETSPTATGTSTSSSRSQRPQTTTFTSTAGDGAVTVVTRTTFVPAEPADATNTQAGGSLQTNAAVPRARNVGVEAFAGIFFGGLFLI